MSASCLLLRVLEKFDPLIELSLKPGYLLGLFSESLLCQTEIIGQFRVIVAQFDYKFADESFLVRLRHLQLLQLAQKL